MHMILNATDLERWRLHVLAGPCKIGMHLLAEPLIFQIFQERNSVLRTPNEMEVDLSK
jgi:hypothetical protein